MDDINRTIREISHSISEMRDEAAQNQRETNKSLGEIKKTLSEHTGALAKIHRHIGLSDDSTEPGTPFPDED